MPNIKSAKKRVLVIEKKNLINRAIESEVKTAIKKFNAAINTNRIEDAEKLLPQTMAIIDSAAQKGVLHKNNAANKKAIISKKLSDVQTGKVTIEIKKDNKTIAAEKAIATRKAREALRVENAQKSAERAAAKEAEKEANKGKKPTRASKKKEEVKKETVKEKKEAKKAEPKKAAPKKAKEDTAKKEAVKEQAEKAEEPKKPAAKKAPAKKTATKKEAEDKSDK